MNGFRQGRRRVTNVSDYAQAPSRVVCSADWSGECFGRLGRPRQRSADWSATPPAYRRSGQSYSCCVPTCRLSPRSTPRPKAGSPLRQFFPENTRSRRWAPSFLPSLRENVRVRTNTVVNLTLNTLYEVMQWLPAEPRAVNAQKDDWKWTLRSAANRPLLRWLEDGPLVVVSEKAGRSSQTEGPPDGYGSAGHLRGKRRANHGGDGEYALQQPRVAGPRRF